MAVVYLARDPLVKRRVAIKVLPRQFTFDPHFRVRFQREAEVVAALEHPHIVRIYDFGEEDDQPFIVMPYMSGGSLADRLRQDGALPIAEVSRLLTALAAALDKAHAQNIVHRDLKPANIMFDADGEPYISDFGIAKITESSSGITGSAILGTPTFMSPEQWKGEKDIDGRSDVYSLGGMLFEMLTGKLPFEADTPGQLMMKHLTEPPRPILQLNPSLPEECDDLIRKAMAKERDERYATAGELADELKQLVGQKSEVGIRKIVETVNVGKKKAESVNVRQKTEADVTNRAFTTIAPTTPLTKVPSAVSAKPVEQRVLSHPTNRGDPRHPLGLLSIRKVLFPALGVLILVALFSFSAPIINNIIPTPTLVIRLTQVSKVSTVDGMTMLYVPAGLFTMGTDSGTNDERPVHTVTLDAFWIDKTEVTNAMYALCVKAGQCSAPSQKSSAKNPNYFGNSQFDTYPAIYVTWENANAYCKWANRQLPTEAQWEKAARSDQKYVYPWGDTKPDQTKLNYSDHVGDTTEVGKYPSGASIYGAMDMTGNVWEWLNDWYDESYYGRSPAQNPTGPTSGQYRILRGGAWGNYDFDVRTSNRSKLEPTNFNDIIGFRCASSP